MAFNNSLSTRLEELRSRNPQSTASENTTGYTTPSRYSGSFMTTHSHPSNDVRASLQRRFTTDLSKMPTLTPIGQPSQVVDPVDISSTVCTYLLWDGFCGLVIVVDLGGDMGKLRCQEFTSVSRHDSLGHANIPFS